MWLCLFKSFLWRVLWYQDQDGRISFSEFQLMVTPPKIDISEELNIKPKDSAKKVTIIDKNENHQANETDKIKTVKNETWILGHASQLTFIWSSNLCNKKSI